MTVDGETARDFARLDVPLAGALEETGDKWMPFRLTDLAGGVVEPVSAFFADLLAAGRSEATVRSYGMDLLRWFRFVWAARVPWNMATRAEARDFCRWMQVAGKPARPHWRAPDRFPVSAVAGTAYSPSVRAHSETVLRSFYEFHLEAGTGPIVNPFPLDRSRRGRRAHAHHNPMEPHRNERAGLYRPTVPSRIPRSVPDEEFNEIFARLPSHRDRALVAFYVSTGARASELLSATQGGADPGRQVIAVTRKGTRAVQELPASTDAFVWLRLYQLEMDKLIPKGRRQPLWWTSRRPFVPLTYHAVHRMFERVGGAVGSAATLHALRHTAAYRMAEDPELPLTDVQHVLGHAQLITTQIYLTPRKEDVVRRVLAHHQEQSRQAAARARPAPRPATVPRRWMCCSGTGRGDRRPGCRRGRGPAGRPGSSPRQVRAASGAAGLADHRRQPRGGARAADRPPVHAGRGWQPETSCPGAEPAAVLAGGPARRQLARALAGERGRYGWKPVAGGAWRVAWRARRIFRRAVHRPVRGASRGHLR